MRKLIITRPEHDDTTYYLSNWSKKELEKADSKGIKVLDLHKQRANRKEVTSMILKQKPDLIIFNGHGDYNIVAGNKNEFIIILGENENLLKGSITYSISCKSAKILGPASIKIGARSYIGYDEDFIFVYDKKMISRPLKDATAKLFLEPSNELINSLLKGNSVGESCKRSKEFFSRNLKKILSSEASQEDAVLSRYVWWDMKHQCYLGNEEAKF